MLQELRNQTQSIGFRILAGAIIVVLTLFGFGATNLFLGSEPMVATIGDYEITEGVLERETERERRKLMFQMGEEFDPNTIDRLRLRSYALEQLVNKEVLFQAAEELNIKASSKYVNDKLVESPAYQKNGRFDEPTYRQQIQMLGYTPVEFLSEYGRSLSAELLRTGISETSFVSSWELKEAIKLLTQRRDIAYLSFTVEDFGRDVEVLDSEMTTRYEEEQDLYLTEISLDLEYLLLTVDSLLGDSSIEISEQEIIDAWKQDQVAASENSKRESSHILIEIGEDRAEEAAKDLATSIYQELVGGADFKGLAEKYSDDAGSAKTGGSLGSIGRGIFAEEFEEALWAMETVGSVSRPVKTDFGFHIIRLEGIQQIEQQELESARSRITERLNREVAEEIYQDKLLELERLAYDERYALTDTAEQLGLTTSNVQGFLRSDQQIEENWLVSEVVLDSIFGEEVPLGENGPPIEIDGGQSVIVRVVERREPEVLGFASVAEEIKQKLIKEKSLAAIESARSSAIKRLSEGDPVSDVADEFGLRWSSHELVRRSDLLEIPREVLNYAFELPRPTDSDKSFGDVNLIDGVAVVTVTRVRDGDPNTLSDTERDQFLEGLVSRNDRVGMNSFFAAAQKELGVERN